MNNKEFFLIVAVTLLLGTLAFMSVQVQTVQALVPTIESVNSHDAGSTTILDITIYHQGSPTPIGPLHFVPVVQLDINGTIVDVTQVAQSTETFTMQYSLGPNTNSYSVRARAFCNAHGYSAQSNPVTVPESIALFLLMVLATVTAVVAKKTLGRYAN